MSQPEFEYLGPYKVERTLGRGGMGTVYKGIHARSGDSVAIKVIAAGIANNMRFRRRFAAEVETLKRLRHSNIVQLLGYGEEQGLLFYSMEYVDGKSLHDYLRQHHQLPWQQVIQIGIEITAALKHAHDFGIIHRDLKPANLMLNPAGQVKLTDFGIAKLFGATDMTAAGSVIGTADYMPPEQAEGKAVTIRSDLYSLGGVLYALLTGRPPFGGKSVPEVLYSVRYNPVPDLQDVLPDVPVELAELIHQLLEKDPLKRPPTALVVGNRLRSMQQGLKVVSSPKDRSQAGEQKKSASNKVGTQLTSLDLSDVDDDELKLTGEEVIAQDSFNTREQVETIVKDEPPGTHELQTLLASESLVEPPSDEMATSSLQNSRGPLTDVGAISGEFHSRAPNTGPITSGGPSHFTPIDSRTKSADLGLDISQQEPGFDWLHYGSMVGMAVTLLASIVLGWWLLRPLPADSLYDEIALTVDSGDDTQLLQVGGLIIEFLERFPEDERAGELEALSNELELTRWSRILQRRASRAGGSENLNAIEQAFLECVKLLGNNADEGRLKLMAFIKVFGRIEDLPKDERKLVKLAEHALQTGPRATENQVSAAALQLQRLIQSAETALPQEKLTGYYEDLLLLYADKPWAAEQVAWIRNKLRTES